MGRRIYIYRRGATSNCALTGAKPHRVSLRLQEAECSCVEAWLTSLPQKAPLPAAL
jgi:hypothetical protein